MGLRPLPLLLSILLCVSSQAATLQPPISCFKILTEEMWEPTLEESQKYQYIVHDQLVAMKLLELERRHHTSAAQIINLYQEIQNHFKQKNMTVSTDTVITLIRVALKARLSGISVTEGLFLSFKEHARQIGQTCSDEVAAYTILTSLPSIEVRKRVIRQFKTALYDVAVVEYLDGRGRKFAKLETSYRELRGYGTPITARELSRDAIMGALDANASVIGKELLGYTIEAGAENAALLWIDLNSLGRVNGSFAKLWEAGDLYLSEVGSVITENIRDEDFFFRNGGDEIVVVIHNNDPSAIKAIITRISQGVAQRAALLEMFQSETDRRLANLKALREAKSFADLGRDRMHKMGFGPESILLIESDFQTGQRVCIEAQESMIEEMKSLKPGVSVGSTLIGRGDTYADVMARAQSQAHDIKQRYKDAIGLDASKYGRSGNASGKRNPDAQPDILDPIPAPGTM